MLFRLNRSTEPFPDNIGGVRVKKSTRAKRMALRLDPKLNDIVLVVPKRTSVVSATRFVTENGRWIADQRAKTPPLEKFQAGMQVSVYGRDYTITHKAGRGAAHFDGNEIVVRGGAEHLSRRLRDFLKSEAEKILREKTFEKTKHLGLAPKAVRVMDPKSRWGSCGTDGRIMYSWRLLLAPPDVLDYVVAHEVAHRVHMNHGRKFWMLCLSLCDNGAASRRWLRSHGQTLMSYT